MGKTAVISEADLKNLVGFNPGGDVGVVSIYLNVDGAKFPRLQDYEKQLHLLVSQAQRQWLASDSQLSKSRKRAVHQDLDKIVAFITGQWHRGSAKGLAIFSCSAADFWQVYALPVSVPSALLLGNEPYAKTLTSVLDEYKRFCVVCVDRKKSRLFTVYLGQIEEHHGIFVDEWVPDQVKEGEWAGLRQSRIARHIEDHVLHHLKDVSRLTFDFFLEHNFDRLILAGPHEVIPKFKQTLHPYLRERLAGYFQIDPQARLAQIHEKSLEVEVEVQRLEEKELVRKLREQNRPGGLGVSGVKPTVDALMKGQVHVLMVGDSYSASGYICYKDHYLSAEAGDCPVCGRRLDEAADIVEDMIQLAITQSVQIEHITHIPEFAQTDRVGAILRFV